MIPTDCGKVPYPNPLTAWRTIRAAPRLTHKKRYKCCTAYPCPRCHQWHIATQGRHDHPADWPRRRAALLEREARI